MTLPTRGYADLHDHVDRLDRAGLLYRITEPVNKDTEMHPLVRWQFRGGIPEKERKAFLFTNIIDAKGRHYDVPVIIGSYAANAEIYRIGMDVQSIEEIGPKWQRAIANPIAPRLVEHGPVHDIVLTADDLIGPGKGLESLPIPISTPGFDAAPYLTATGVITCHPDSRVQNLGTYRAQLKSSNRLGVNITVHMRSGGIEHWKMYRQRGERMPIAITVGAPPFVAFQGPQRLPLDVDEIAVAGGLAGSPINVVRGKTVNLLIPAEAELVVEGFVAPDYLEPEGPFGESHGYVALEDYNIVVDVTAITRRRDALITSIVSQVTPSESSVVKRLAYEPLFLRHLRDQLGISGLRRVSLHEPLTNLRRFVFLQFARGTPRTEVWRALQGAAIFQTAVGKFVIAVDEDIDPENADSVFWAMSYRCNPAEDMHIFRHRARGHVPRLEANPSLDSALLVDATMKQPMPPLALPKREYMEQAKLLWERLGLPPLHPETPWHGYSLGDWIDEWDSNAKQATQAEWMNRSESYRQRRRTNVEPNTPVRTVEDECS